MATEPRPSLRWRLVPVRAELNPVNVWEHTPLNPYKGEYPRFLRPVRDETRTRWELVPAEKVGG